MNYTINIEGEDGSRYVGHPQSVTVREGRATVYETGQLGLSFPVEGPKPPLVDGGSGRSAEDRALLHELADRLWEASEDVCSRCIRAGRQTCTDDSVCGAVAGYRAAVAKVRDGV